MTARDESRSAPESRVGCLYCDGDGVLETTEMFEYVPCKFCQDARATLEAVADGFTAFYGQGQDGLHELLNTERLVRAALSDGSQP